MGKACIAFKLLSSDCDSRGEAIGGGKGGTAAGMTGKAFFLLTCNTLTGAPTPAEGTRAGASLASTGKGPAIAFCMSLA